MCAIITCRRLNTPEILVPDLILTLNVKSRKIDSLKIWACGVTRLNFFVFEVFRRMIIFNIKILKIKTF